MSKTLFLVSFLVLLAGCAKQTTKKVDVDINCNNAENFTYKKLVVFNEKTQKWEESNDKKLFEYHMKLERERCNSNRMKVK